MNAMVGVLGSEKLKAGGSTLKLRIDIKTKTKLKDLFSPT